MYSPGYSSVAAALLMRNQKETLSKSVIRNFQDGLQDASSIKMDRVHHFGRKQPDPPPPLAISQHRTYQDPCFTGKYITMYRAPCLHILKQTREGVWENEKVCVKRLGFKQSFSFSQTHSSFLLGCFFRDQGQQVASLTVGSRVEMTLSWCSSHFVDP